MITSHSNTALILVGFQTDYFAKDGILHGVVSEALQECNTLKNTCRLLESLKDSDITIISTPILFTEDFSEVVEPVGILKTIVDVGAFRRGSPGSQTIDEIRAYGDRIVEVPGKRGLDAFSNTKLEEALRGKGIKNVILAGVVTSLCVDSTARRAFELGFKVHILEDCTSGRTAMEQSFYCQEVFPLYSQVIDSEELLAKAPSSS